jgi:hypothetical protein
MNTNPLLSTWESYQTSQACFQVVSGINQHQDTKSIDLEQKIERSKSDSEDLFVLLLWIKFEQCTRAYLQEQGKNKLYDTSYPVSLASSIFASFEKDEEFWNAIELLELLQSTLSIPEDLIDKAQQISFFAYNILKKHQSKITANDAYETLTKVVEFMI